MTKHLITSLMLIFLLSVPVSYAQDTVKSVISEAAQAGFSELERQLINKYIGENKQTDQTPEVSDEKPKKGGKSMPPGLAKRDSLPPGLASQLQRNGTLPPGLAKRELPADLENQLPPVKEGYERSILEDMSVVLVEKATGKIADIITDVISGDDTTDRRN